VTCNLCPENRFSGVHVCCMITRLPSESVTLHIVPILTIHWRIGKTDY